MDGNLTQEWKEYQEGIDYKRKLKPEFYSTIDKNERFYAGDQWNGVKSNGLPTPVFNIFKRVINYLISAVLSQKVTMKFSAFNVATDDPEGEEARQTAEKYTNHANQKWETEKMDSMLRKGLLDAALSGDCAIHTYWDSSIYVDGINEGDFTNELVDNVNVFFGNPNTVNIQKQPYILIAGRETVATLREEAKKYGSKDLDMISADEDTQYASGDRGKIELNTSETNGKTTYLIKYWRNKKTGTIWMNKSCKNVVIRKDIDTGLTCYPIAWMNWDARKNSFHGQALGTGLIPNQIYINKQFAMVMYYLMTMANPKVIYDKTRISGWSNALCTAIGVQGEISNAAQYLTPPSISGMVIEVINMAIDLTKNLMGATDAGMGEVKPDNTSAIIAVQQAAAIPLEGIKANLYQFVEDLGNVWMDYMNTKYAEPRTFSYDKDGATMVDTIQSTQNKMRLKIDVGPSSYWSEIASMQTLDNLLMNNKIDFIQYLDRLPDGILPKKAELIDEMKQKLIPQQMPGQDNTAQYEQMAQFIESLPEEEQIKIQQMPPQKMESYVMQMMGGNMNAA